MEAEHLTVKEQTEAEQAGVAAFTSLVADPSLVAESRAILELLQSEQEVAANLHVIHLSNVRRQRLFAYNEEKETALIRSATNDHENGGSDKKVIETIMSRIRVVFLSNIAHLYLCSMNYI